MLEELFLFSLFFFFFKQCAREGRRALRYCFQSEGSAGSVSLRSLLPPAWGHHGHGAMAREGFGGWDGVSIAPTAG